MVEFELLQQMPLLDPPIDEELQLELQITLLTPPTIVDSHEL
jgi:hypothetical protein